MRLALHYEKQGQDGCRRYRRHDTTFNAPSGLFKIVQSCACGELVTVFTSVPPLKFLVLRLIRLAHFVARDF